MSRSGRRRRSVEDEEFGSTFFEKSDKQQIQALVSVLSKNIPQAKFRKMLQLAVRYFKTYDLAEDVRKSILEDKKSNILFLGLLIVIQNIIKKKVKLSIVGKDLQKLGFAKDHIDDILAVIKTKGGELTDSRSSQQAFPTLSDVAWRVDVVISTTSLSRAFKPIVMMQMTLSDGRIRSFECSLQKFHELRYNVAKSLKGIHNLRSHPTLMRNID